MQPDRNLTGFALLGLGLLLVFSPWLFGYDGREAATASACLMGGLLLPLGVASLSGARVWPEAVALTAAAWTMVAPLVLGFLNEGAAAGSHMIVGAAVLILSACAPSRRSQDLPEIKA